MNFTYWVPITFSIWYLIFPQPAAQILNAMEEVAEEEFQGMPFMNFFIMWLCFYTTCILALYAGARHDRRSENSLSHRQIQQLQIEYLQTIRKQQFGIRTYWVYEPNTSALTTVRFGAPSIFSVSPHAVRAPLPAVDPNFSLS